SKHLNSSSASFSMKSVADSKLQLFFKQRLKFHKSLCSRQRSGNVLQLKNYTFMLLDFYTWHFYVSSPSAILYNLLKDISSMIRGDLD
uniref:Maturase K n=1 Tax=Parascaris univalens TaxID=6257 RepID=A0A915B611_PARUN